MIYAAGTKHVEGIRRRRLCHYLLHHRQKIVSESGRPAVRHPLRGSSHETHHHRRKQERPGTFSRHRKTGFDFLLSAIYSV